MTWNDLTNGTLADADEVMDNFKRSTLITDESSVDVGPYNATSTSLTLVKTYTFTPEFTKVLPKGIKINADTTTTGNRSFFRFVVKGSDDGSQNCDQSLSSTSILATFQQTAGSSDQTAYFNLSELTKFIIGDTVDIEVYIWSSVGGITGTIDDIQLTLYYELQGEITTSSGKFT